MRSIPLKSPYVVNVLDMWDAIERGYEGLSEDGKELFSQKAGQLADQVTFTGFDGHNEPDHVSIARFLTGELNRFSRFDGRDLSSNMPTRAGYERMLRVFKALRRELMGTDLGVEQIVSLLLARKAPDE